MTKVTVNGYGSYLESCSAGEHSGSSRFETSSNSTVGTMPCVGKQRITDVPRINRSECRSPIFFHNNNTASNFPVGGGKKSSQRNQQQQVMFDSDYVTNDEEERRNGRYPTSCGSERHPKFGRQNHFDQTAIQPIGKPLRFSTGGGRPTDRNGFKEGLRRTTIRSGSPRSRNNVADLKPLNNWRMDNCGNNNYVPLQNNRLTPNYYSEHRRSGDGGYGGNYRNSNFQFQYRYSSQPKPLAETAPSPISWRQGGGRKANAGSNSGTSSTPGSLTVSSSTGGIVSLMGSGDDSFASTSVDLSGSSSYNNSKQHQPLATVPTPLVNITTHKPALLSSNQQKLPLRSISILNGHNKNYMPLSASSTTTAAWANQAGPAVVGRRSTGTFKRSSNKKPSADEHNQKGEHLEERRSVSRSDFNFVDQDFPSLEGGKHTSGSLEEGESNVACQQASNMIKQNAIPQKSQSRSSARCPLSGSINYSAIVAGARRRASSSEVEGSVVPIKQNLKSYAQTLLTAQKTKILRRESSDQAELLLSG